MKDFSLDHLSDTEFEEFCFDLLGELGFRNRSWRKGTGLSSSPSDQGRDIVAERLIVDDIDGAATLETWFFECKHYKQGVPPTAIQNALAWAQAERPAKLVLLVSNFLSNPAKGYLEQYKHQNRPPFIIKIWERPDIETLSLSKSLLLRKYNIGGDMGFLKIIHPNHARFIKETPHNSLDVLFSAMEDLGIEVIIQHFGLSLLHVTWNDSPLAKKEDGSSVYPRMNRELYDACKRKCYDIVKRGLISQYVLTHTNQLKR